MYPSPPDNDARIVKAASSGDLENLKQLALDIGDEEEFRRKCEISRDSDGLNALHHAAKKGTIQMCKFLIDKVKVDIHIKTEKGESPLLLALAGENPLLLALTGVQINTAKYLIIRGAEIALSDSKGLTALHYAAGKDSKELMQLLLLKGADIEANSVTGTPLHCAISSGNVESVRFLLGRGAKPNSVSPLLVSSLMRALFSHSIECLKLLLEAGADPNITNFGMSPLAYAALHGEARVVRSLLEAGANPNSAGADCMRPIEYAASAGKDDCVRILFPVTRSIPIYPDWSVRGLMDFFRYEISIEVTVRRREASFEFAKQIGEDAVRRENYSDAIKWFTEAIYLNKSDANLLLNRSLCWACLHEAACALFDAEACVRLKPDWPEAHYREGVAWKLLKNDLKATAAFAKALRLDPTNTEINKAFGEAVSSAYPGLAAPEVLRVLSEILER